MVAMLSFRAIPNDMDLVYCTHRHDYDSPDFGTHIQEKEEVGTQPLLLFHLSSLYRPDVLGLAIL